jgi:hypothetical protein
MSNYLDLLVQQDKLARTSYSYDPRVAMNQTRMLGSIEPFSNGTKDEIPTVSYTDQIVGSHSDSAIVQTSPDTVGVKRYIVIDSSQRDWVKQPNPFSNLVFTFGTQNTSSSNPPVYSNNPFVPTFADEQTALQNPIPGIPNTRGWTFSNTPYPAYNSSIPNGNFIGYDLGYSIQPSGSGFGSVFTPCNVSSVRLVRAVMPQRQFLNLPIVPVGDGSDISSYIQASLPNTSFSTFATYPYLMLYLNEYFGQYVGGNEPTRRSFSVMTQRQRQQISFTSNSLGVQQFDYEPWGEESLYLQSPITNLQRIQISVSDPIGNIFTHLDNLQISLMQTDSNKMYIKCFTPAFSYFSGNEMRIGDRIVFYPATISNMMKSQYLAVQNSDKRKFIEQLLTGTFPVLDLLDYVENPETGVWGPRTVPRTTPYISSYNGFVIPNFFTVGDEGSVAPTFPNSIDNGTFTILEPNSLVGSNLEFMNASLQPVYTLELEIRQPDTGKIGGKIVL